VKLARYLQENRVDYGFIVGGAIIPHGDVAPTLPSTLDELVKSGLLASPEALLEISSLIPPVRKGISLKKVKLLNPLDRPGKVICLGRNYPEPAIEGGYKPPKGLAFVLKPNTSLAGPYDQIILPNNVKMLDYEGELVVVVGRTSKWATNDDVPKMVLGYMIANDVSARDIQIADRQWTRGKSYDTFAPMGPWITTKEELPIPLSLYIRTWVNEELRQDGNTASMFRKVEEVVSELTQGMTLEAGDLILTGTPAGVGFYTRPEPRLLSAGDKVRVEIERLGYIENEIKASTVDITKYR